MNLEGENKRTTPRQIIRILFLRISTLATKFGYEGEVRQAMSHLETLAKYVSVYLKKGDIHYEQIKHNAYQLFYFLEANKAEVFTTETKNSRNRILQTFDEPQELAKPKPPPALEKRLEMLQKTERYD